MRRVVITVSSLFVAVVALVSAAPAAFAAQVAPPAGGSPVNLAPVVHHSGGLAIWAVALIATAGVVLLAAAALGARLMTTSRRTASTPATA
jgi:hypothetical protein